MENAAEEDAAQPVLTRLQLFEALGSKIMSKVELCDFVKSKLGVENCSEEITECLQGDLKDFVDNFTRRWKQVHRSKAKFISEYSDWLKEEITFSKIVYDSKLTENLNPRTPSTSKVGRPRKLFHESSEKSKRRKIQPLLSAHSEQELIHATQVSLHMSGKRDAAKMVKETLKSPHRATKIKKSYISPAVKPVPLTGEEALSFLVDNNYSKSQYMNMQLECKNRNCNIFPPYHIIRERKQKCYPPSESITITETSATITLQSLVDHTIERLAVVQEDVLKQSISSNDTVHIILKWGCDGSSGHSQYKQKFTDDDGSDTDIFVVSVVPLQMYSLNVESNNEKKILWQNPRPSSTRFCRPLKLLFEKETVELTRREVQLVEAEIMSLQPSKINIDDQYIYINQTLLLTMVDGKVCNSITGSSAQRCYVCGAGPREMNNTLSKTVCPEESYKFGLSTLHCWIRFFECLLHISYKIEIKKWQARGDEDKRRIENRKKVIQNKFRSEMGLHVDKPRSGGVGNSNDGNTARRFFEDPVLSSKITGINEELIRRFSTILCALSCQFPINTSAFKTYTQDTAKLYINLYPWYYMPVTVHKVLIHGADIIDFCIIPIGQLSEEAQESRNKDLRKYRFGHSRKFSRKHTNEDILHMILIFSDTVISHKTKIHHKKRRALSSEVLQLLKEPDVPAHHEQHEAVSDDDASDDT